MIQQLATDVVARALKLGATEAECTVAEGNEFSASVRLGEVEQLKEAGSRGAGIRVLVGQRTGSATTSDLTKEGVERMVRAAIENASVTTDDPFAGLPDEAELGSIDVDLETYSESVEQLEAEWKIAQAKAAEAAALQFDPRITNSEGGSFDTYLSSRAFANSRGFSGLARSSSCSISAVPVAKEGEKMERDYWFSIARRPDRLEAADLVGRLAAQRAVRRLGARKVSTQKVPIVFEPRIARTLLANLFEAVSGDSIYRQASFLNGQLGARVASEYITVIDDPTIPGLFGSSPFDDEGVRARRKVVVERGILKTYLHNTYTAKKLGTTTTGNAARGLAGNAYVDHGNFFLEAGSKTPEQMIGGIKSGLYVTELMGQGVNVVNGDYSRGAAGMWIENGELAYPVSEITIAGNLKQMLLDIEEPGVDLEFRGSIASPTLMIREMTVSGN
ncbi:MAG: metallopeptidase TldD-related protein [Acidobacteria bacterium]|nr:metallopeptidase TldD-related protein [Acidobacteriota bacterium]